MIESQRAAEAKANEAALETLKAQYEERVSIMLSSSEAGKAELKTQADHLQARLGDLQKMLSSSEARETELRTQVKDLQTRLNEKESLLSSAEAGKTELQTQLASKPELLSEKEDMS